MRLILAFLGMVALASAGDLRVVSYNIRHGEGMDRKLDLARTAEVLKKLKPDFVALQEVDKKAARSGGVDQAAELGKMLGMHHAFGKFMDYQGGEYGLAVLSKTPIVETHVHKLPDGAEPRVVLEVVIQPEGPETRLSFASIHLDWKNEDIRLVQFKGLEKALESRQHPIVLAGDFNARPKSPTMEFVAKNWLIVPKSGERATFPADRPRPEIDFIVTRNIDASKATSLVVDEKVASDHRPVLAVIPLP